MAVEGHGRRGVHNAWGRGTTCQQAADVRQGRHIGRKFTSYTARLESGTFRQIFLIKVSKNDIDFRFTKIIKEQIRGSKM